MKGLFLIGFYGTLENMKLFAWIVAVAGLILILTGNATAQELFIYIAITMFSMNGLAVSRKDTASKWNKFEITLPVKRKEIIKSKYVCHLFWIMVGFLCAAAVTVITLILHGNLAAVSDDIGRYASLFILGTGIAFMVGAIYHPLLYLIGLEKSETILVISILGAVGTVILVIGLLNRFLVFQPAVRLALFTVFYITMLILSYLLTVCVYRAKEY